MKKAVISVILILSIVLTACSSSVNPANSETTEITTSSETICMSETAITQPSEQVDYDFEWGKQENEDFDKYVREKCDGLTLSGYVGVFGFTNELNEMLTDFVNSRFGVKYRYIPFSKVRYFRGIMKYGALFRLRDYEFFYNICLRNDRTTLNNKLLLSFFVQNEIPFGARISKECIENIYGDNVYTLLTKQVKSQGSETTYSEYLYHVWHIKDLGNGEYSHMYSNKDLACILLYYEMLLDNLLESEDIQCLSFFYGDPQYEEQSKNAITLYNWHFRTFFGDNAPQFGKVITKEQYKQLFGEEPFDLSYIRGATNNPFTVIAGPDGKIIEVY